MRRATYRDIDERRWALGVGKLHVLLVMRAPRRRLPDWRWRYQHRSTIEPTWNLRWRLRSRVWQLRVVWARWGL